MSHIYDQKPWLRHYDAGVPETVEIPDVPVHYFLEEAGRNFGERTAVIFQGRSFTYQQINQMADNVAAALIADGFQPGERAMIYMCNCPQFVAIYFGILKAGGVVVSTNPMYTERELRHQLHDSGASTAFVMSNYYELLKNVQSNSALERVIVTKIKTYLPLHLKLLFGLFRERAEGHHVSLHGCDQWFTDFLETGKDNPSLSVAVSSEDVAVLQYTGGTTGLSKGAIGTHRNLVANAKMLRSWVPTLHEGEEVVLAALPYFHGYGMVVSLITPVLMAATLIVIPDPRDQKDILRSINKYRPTLFPGVPAMYVAINNNPEVVIGKFDIRSIKACFSASAPLLVETKARFESLTGGKLVEAYGLTEAHVATHANPMFGESRRGAMGIPLPNIDCRIVDVEDSSRILPPCETGEIIMKGPNIMAGYWQMPDETAHVLRDGWLYTGDIAHMDEDGYFYIVDRKKDMIIAGGYNVYPREIEEVLMQHPGVAEVGVAGIPDERRGETVMAWVVKQPGDRTTEAELIEWSKSQLAAYKYPRFIEFRDELPKSAVGKILKRELVIK